MDEHTIKSTYEMYKRSAKYHFDKLHYDECLTSIIYACKLAYTFNWIYTDDELESIVHKIAKHFNITQNVQPIENRIVLYDNFAMSNRGLTQQYLRALVKLHYDILLIITRSPNEIDKKMQMELESYSKLNIEYVPQNKFASKIQQIEKIIELVMKFKPAKAFMHMTPFDVAGNVAWNALSFVQRYQINLTDHAFWLGIRCSDYILEFRHYGYSLSIQMRHVPKEKLLLLPYYPIYDTDIV